MRKNKSKTKLVLKERDYTVLRFVYEYRFLSGELLWYLVKPENQPNHIFYSTGRDGKKRPTRYGFGRQTLFKRLKQLFDAGYLNRHYITDQPMGRGHGLPRAIYGLGGKSPEILNELEGVPIKQIKRIIESNSVKSLFLRHALEVAYFRVILTLACQNLHGRVILLFWEQGNYLKDYVYGYNGRGIKEKFTIHADAFLGIQIGDKTKHYFLEIDRGTEPIVSHSNRSNIRRKLRGYQYYHKSKKISKKYDLDIYGFQVLIVTPGGIKTGNNLTGRIANVYNEITVNSKIYPTKSLFLLTTSRSLNLTMPESIFASIWISQKSQHSLLSLIE